MARQERKSELNESTASGWAGLERLCCWLIWPYSQQQHVCLRSAAICEAFVANICWWHQLELARWAEALQVQLLQVQPRNGTVQSSASSSVLLPSINVFHSHRRSNVRDGADTLPGVGSLSPGGGAEQMFWSSVREPQSGSLISGGSRSTFSTSLEILWGYDSWVVSAVTFR